MRSRKALAPAIAAVILLPAMLPDLSKTRTMAAGFLTWCHTSCTALDHERVGQADRHKWCIGVGPLSGFDRRADLYRRIHRPQPKADQRGLLLVAEQKLSKHFGGRDLLRSHPRNAVQNRVRVAEQDGPVMRIRRHQRLPQLGSVLLIEGYYLSLVGGDRVEVLGAAGKHLAEKPVALCSAVDFRRLERRDRLTATVGGLDVLHAETSAFGDAQRAHQNGAQRARIGLTDVTVTKFELAPGRLAHRSPAIRVARKLADRLPCALRLHDGPTAEGLRSRLPHRDDKRSLSDNG